MGNCSLKGVTGECHYSIRILSDWGAVLHFTGPKTVGEVLREYPGYGVFRQGHASAPLPEQESLSYGLLYYLLPLLELEDADAKTNGDNNGKGFVEGSEALEYVENLSNGSALEVLPSAGNGVWKVKLVIDTRHLEEILSEQVNTEALIEKMRMAASATSSSSPNTTRRRRTRMTSWKVGSWKPTLFNTVSKERLSTQNFVHKSTSSPINY